MISEEQRRALFALREALHLCEGADVHLYSCMRQGSGLTSLQIGRDDFNDDEFAVEDVDRLLAEHPEEEPERVEHGFKVGQTLRCRHVPDRHEGYFTPGNTYEVDALDTSDTALPLLMNCDSSVTLWCEASAFEATA